MTEAVPAAGRLLAIGDVHGCPLTLDALLDALAPLGPADTLVFVGDYVDRGPDTPGVLDRCLDLAARHRCVFLRGNHDQMLLDYAEGRMTGEDVAFWVQHNGGGATLAQYAARAGTPADPRPAIPPAHVAFLRATRLFFEAEGAVFVHAGLDPHRRVDEQLARPDAHTLLWTRDHLAVPDAERAWERPVVCGHTPHPEPLDEPTLVLVDTGACKPDRPGLGRLTALVWPARTFVAANYAEPVWPDA